MHNADHNHISGILSQYIGSDLRTLAETCGITVIKDGKKNKGWVGHVIEELAGLPRNCVQAPNGYDFELKVVSCKRDKGTWVVKETMAITMINPDDVLRRSFHESHLLAKLQRLIICAREWVSDSEPRARLLKVVHVELNDALMAQVKADYEECQEVIKTRGFRELSGRMGVLVQPRTKGPGHGSTSRAFYARKVLVRELLGDLPDWE